MARVRTTKDKIRMRREIFSEFDEDFLEKECSRNQLEDFKRYITKYRYNSTSLISSGNDVKVKVEVEAEPVSTKLEAESAETVIESQQEEAPTPTPSLSVRNKCTDSSNNIKHEVTEPELDLVVPTTMDIGIHDSLTPESITDSGLGCESEGSGSYYRTSGLDHIDGNVLSDTFDSDYTSRTVSVISGTNTDMNEPNSCEDISTSIVDMEGIVIISTYSEAHHNDPINRNRPIDSDSTQSLFKSEERKTLPSKKKVMNDESASSRRKRRRSSGQKYQVFPAKATKRLHPEKIEKEMEQFLTTRMRRIHEIAKENLSIMAMNYNFENLIDHGALLYHKLVNLPCQLDIQMERRLQNLKERYEEEDATFLESINTLKYLAEKSQLAEGKY